MADSSLDLDLFIEVLLTPGSMVAGKPGDFELDGLSQNRDGADKLRLREFFLERVTGGVLAAEFGIDSLSDSGRKGSPSESVDL